MLFCHYMISSLWVYALFYPPHSTLTIYACFYIYCVYMYDLWSIDATLCDSLTMYMYAYVSIFIGYTCMIYGPYMTNCVTPSRCMLYVSIFTVCTCILYGRYMTPDVTLSQYMLFLYLLCLHVCSMVHTCHPVWHPHCACFMFLYLLCVHVYSMVHTW